MKITSHAFGNNSKIPSKYTCVGENINPPLEFFDIPGNTKSLVLIMDDPDAPMGTFIHWVLYNIDPKEKEIKENSIPKSSIQGLNSMNKSEYAGPCPPSGTHRYFFKLYALDSILEQFPEKMGEHIISQAELIGLYSK
ncbi:MAG: YbhB/YbcL family Raf kinase inhibitor-like protein [bacterium]|nr:YbhB/YbcL family Raf kinase inhibitor-like protein [bacterium]